MSLLLKTSLEEGISVLEKNGVIKMCVLVFMRSLYGQSPLLSTFYEFFLVIGYLKPTCFCENDLLSILNGFSFESVISKSCAVRG